MVTASLTLENFDALPAPTELTAAVDMQAEYERGFQDGIEATKAARDRADKTSLENVTQTLSDIDITFAEATEVLRASLAPLIDAISEKLLPCIARGAVNPILQSIVDDAVLGAADTVEIALSPSEHEALSAHLHAPDDLALTCMCDPSLRPGQFELRTNLCEQFFDVDRVAADISQALSAVCAPTERSIRHG